MPEMGCGDRRCCRNPFVLGWETKSGELPGVHRTMTGFGEWCRDPFVHDCEELPLYVGLWCSKDWGCVCLLSLRSMSLWKGAALSRCVVEALIWLHPHTGQQVSKRDEPAPKGVTFPPPRVPLPPHLGLCQPAVKAVHPLSFLMARRQPS